MIRCRDCPYDVRRLSQTSLRGHTITGTEQAIMEAERMIAELHDAKVLIHKTTESIESLLKEYRALRIAP